MKVGVNGYLLKDSGKDQFLEAIHTVMNGEKYFDQRVTEVIMNSLQPPKKHSTILTPLSPREKEIVRLIAKGDNTMEMAEKLHLSQLTIETHRKNIYTKLGMNKIASLVHYAINEGLFEEEWFEKTMFKHPATCFRVIFFIPDNRYKQEIDSSDFWQIISQVIFT